MNFNNNVDEDAPVMRSVAMHSGPAMPAPRMLSARPKVSQVSVASTKQLQPAAAWKVRELMSIPPMYFLERTHVYVKDSTPQEIATRVAECLRKESVAATYNSKEASLKAETGCNVEFMVRLWSDSSQVVVETQRISGCGFVYRQCSRAVLKAAKGVTVKRQAPLMRPMPLPKGLPMQSEDDQVSSAKEGYEIACSLLEKDRMDAHKMALESLSQMTRASSCRTVAADMIMSGKVLETLLSLVEVSRMDRKDRESNLNEKDMEHFAMMQRLALTILANCLIALDETGKLSCFVQNKDLQSEGFLVALVDVVAQAEKRPHEACQACKCIDKLMGLSAGSRRRMLDLGVPEIIDTAHRAGGCMHSQLHDATSKLREQMGGL